MRVKGGASILKSGLKASTAVRAVEEGSGGRFRVGAADWGVAPHSRPP